MKRFSLLAVAGAIVAASGASAQSPRTPPPPPIGADSAGMFFISYPEASLRRSEQGVVRYLLNVDMEGMPTECVVTASSGFERLDRLTCSAAAQYARFTPTRDESGSRTRAVYEGRVDWRIR